MKSAFGSKRRARKIEVDEDEDEDEATGSNSTSNSSESLTQSTEPPTSLKFGRKPLKKSGLRQSITIDQDLEDGGDRKSTSNSLLGLNKPSIGRSSSMKKKKVPSSRLSFGPGEIISGDAAEALEDDETFTTKVTFGRRVVEGNAVRRSLPYQDISRDGEEDDERPTYSKDYLNQLKSSTPTTPKDLQHLTVTLEDEAGLDASELEGAMIVDVDEKFGSGAQLSSIPTEAEIREKKERRARLAHEQDFISLDDVSNDRRELSLLPRKKKEESRLVREDEDLGEGFDEFVDDGRVALGKKQERETRRRQKKEMADIILQAEGNSEEESDDSEAERRAAYEAAQTRAGMDGLHKPDTTETTSAQMPSKITPLPVLNECLARLQSTLSSMELQLARKRKKLDESKQERLDIAAREREVQELLKQAGERYAALRADSNGAVADPQFLADGGVSPMVVDRGLESFGNTPVVRPAVEDVG